MYRVLWYSHNGRTRQNGFDKPLCFACGKACADHYAGCSGSLSSAAGTPDHSVITPVFQRAIDTQTCRNENHDILFRVRLCPLECIIFELLSLSDAHPLRQAFYPPHVSGPEFQFVRNFCQYEGPEPGDLTRAPASMMDPCNTLSMHNTALYDYAYLRWSVHQSPGPPQVSVCFVAELAHASGYTDALCGDIEPTGVCGH